MDNNNSKTPGDRLNSALEDAQLAFWAEIVKHYPEATSGDCDPLDLHQFDNACKAIVSVWIKWNVPKGEAAMKNKQVEELANQGLSARTLSEKLSILSQIRALPEWYEASAIDADTSKAANAAFTYILGETKKP